MSVSVEIYLHKKEKAHDFGYVYMRIGVPGLPYKYKSLKYKIPEKLWDAEAGKVKKAFPNAVYINLDIDNQKNAIEKELLIKKAGSEITRDDLKYAVKGKGNVNSFIDFYHDRITFKAKEMKDGKPVLNEKYIDHLWSEYNSLYKFTDGKLRFSDVTTQFLEDYETYLSPKVASTTLNTKMKRLMEYVNMAVRKGFIKGEKVEAYKIPGYMNPDRLYHTIEQIDALSELVYQNKVTGLIRAVNAFYVVECLSGLRFSDWSRFIIETVIDEPALRVRTKKTGEHVYLYLNDWKRLAKMCFYIRDNNIVAPVKEREVNMSLKIIKDVANKEGAGINFDFTSHNGRHSAATLLAMLGYSDSEGGEILGITPDSFAIYRKNTRQGSRNAQKRLGGV